MKYKKELLFICLLIFLFGIANASAGDVNGTVVANNDQSDNHIDTLNKNDKYYITNQTTLAHSYLEEYHNKIKNTLPNIIIENNICLATTKREVALYNIKTDLIVVVGDSNSSNTLKLVEVAKNKATAKDVILVDRASDLLNYDLKKYQEAFVTSGASTPNILVDQVIRFLSSDGMDLDIIKEELILF